MLKDRKFLILVGLIIFFPLLTLILTASLQGCENRGSNYQVYEKNMIRAAEKYFKKNKILLKSEGKTARVSLNTLVSNNYIKSSENALKDSTCKGSVVARMNGISQEKNKDGFVNYLAFLECKKYKTQTLGELLKESITETKSGLYKFDDEYIFKGDDVKNYITFFDKNYRIMGITSNGLVKLIKTESEPITRMWDNKYNIEVKQSFGKTIYSDSMILKYLTNDYFTEKKISSEARKHLVANNTCIGRRSKKDFSISRQLDCQDIIENQFITLMNVSDYALASIDPDCNSVVSRSCNNYNYLKNVASSSWTPNSVTENSYEALNISGGTIVAQNASQYNYYSIVIFIDMNEKVSSGEGTVENPYIIK